jgi:hypothetical protein
MKPNPTVGPNGLNPNLMSTAERHDELARILAQGLHRRQSSPDQGTRPVKDNVQTRMSIDGVPGQDPRQELHLDQVALARRWRISPRTLERWRWERQGPIYLKVGGRVLYRLSDIIAFEAQNVRTGR